MIEQPAASSKGNPPPTIRRSRTPEAVIPAAEVPTLQSTKIPILGHFRKLGRFPQVHGYEILGELGRGGMGVVYRAKQLRLNRVVALKMLLHPEEADPSDVIRFRSEAEAVASVKHPHIVQVHEFGMCEGNPYFAMEFLNAGTLHTQIQSEAPFQPDRAAKLVEKLARAIHAAHSQGIVHRDLKPGNVLFDAAGEPRVTDFGLAKRVSHQMTRTQAIMGTPGYMPPEQAAGNAKRVGPAADIYALGVILYECLAGKLPFEASDSMALLHKVIHNPAPSLRSKNRTLPRDLDLICLKCLEKDPNDRYPTAASLADDLARFVSKDTVSVRPAGPVERTVKWAKRRPTLAAAYGLGALAVFLAVFGLGALTLWRTALSARDEATVQRGAAIDAGAEIANQKLKVEKQKYDLEMSNVKLRKAKEDLEKSNRSANDALLALDKEKKKVDDSLANEKAAVQKLEAEQEKIVQLRYFRDVGTAQKELNERNFLRAIQLLEGCPEHLRGWEWWHVYKAAHPDIGSGYSGNVPIDASFDGVTGRNVFTSDAMGAITRFDFNTGKGILQQLHPSHGVDSTKISANGKRAITIGTNENHPQKPFEIFIWDTANAQCVAKWPAQRENTTAHAISGDGTRVIVGVGGRAVRVFDVSTGKELPTLKDIQLPVSKARLGTTGATAAVITNTEILVWETASGQAKKRIPAISGDVYSISAVGNDDNLLAFGSRNGTLNFDYVAAPKDREAIAVKKAHIGPISNIAFHPGGALAATAGEDGAVRIWDIATGKMTREFYGHTRRVHGLNFNPSGDFLVSSDEGFMFRVWPVHSSKSPIYPISVPVGTPGKIITDRNAYRVFATGDDRLAPLWPGNQAQLSVKVPEGQRITTAAFHPTKEQITFGTDKGFIYLWDYVGEVRLLGNLQAAVEKIEYSSDGGRLLAARQKMSTVWDTATRKLVKQLNSSFDSNAIAISPDGKWVAAGYDTMLECTQVDTGLNYNFHVPDRVASVGFTPQTDGVAVGTRGWHLDIYKIEPFAQPSRTFVGHTTAITSFAFSTDGKQLAAGGSDGLIKVWDIATNEEALGLNIGEREPIQKLAHIPKVGWIATIPNKPPMIFDGSPGQLAIKAPKPKQTGK